MLVGRSMTTQIVAIARSIIARRAVEPTGIGNDLLVAISALVPGQVTRAAAGAVARRAVELLGLDGKLLFGGDLWLRSPRGCKASSRVLRSLVGAKLAIIRPPDSPAPVGGNSSHVPKLLWSEVEVVNAIENAFSERIVVAKAFPSHSAPIPVTIRKVVRRGTIVHGPENEVKGSL